LNIQQQSLAKVVNVYLKVWDGYTESAKHRSCTPEQRRKEVFEEQMQED
jgi:hypothetical protein